MEKTTISGQIRACWVPKQSTQSCPHPDCHRTTYIASTIIQQKQQYARSWSKLKLYCKINQSRAEPRLTNAKPQTKEKTASGLKISIGSCLRHREDITGKEYQGYLAKSRKPRKKRPQFEMRIYKDYFLRTNSRHSPGVRWETIAGQGEGSLCASLSKQLLLK